MIQPRVPRPGQAACAKIAKNMGFNSTPFLSTIAEVVHVFWSGPGILVAGKEIKQIDLGPWLARVYDGFDSTGLCDCHYLFSVLEKASGKQVFQVSSEFNDLELKIGPDGHFLCTFDGQVHVNHGCASCWGEIAVFEAAAMILTRQHLGGRRGRKHAQHDSIYPNRETFLHGLRD